ncbi:hypothetical protein BD311DRAFT_772237, partial [Dichomitus squalens]
NWFLCRADFAGCCACLGMVSNTCCGGHSDTYFVAVLQIPFSSQLYLPIGPNTMAAASLHREGDKGAPKTKTGVPGERGRLTELVVRRTEGKCTRSHR